MAIFFGPNESPIMAVELAAPEAEAESSFAAALAHENESASATAVADAPADKTMPLPDAFEGTAATDDEKYEPEPYKTDIDADDDTPPFERVDDQGRAIKSEPTAEATAAAAAAMPEHLLAAAAAFDIDVKEFSTAAHLEGAIAAHTKFLGKLLPQGTEVKQPETVAPVVDKKPEPVAAPAAAVAGDLKLDLSAFDPDLHAGLQPLVALVNAQHRELADLKAQVSKAIPQVESLADQSQRQRHQQTVETFDNTIEKLGKAWEPVFGSGTESAVDRKSEGFVNRAKTFQLAAVIQQTKAKAGEPVSFAKAAEMAAHALFPNQLKSIARQEVTEAVRNRQGQFINRPTKRVPGPEDPETKALSNLKARMKAMSDE